MRRLLLFRLGLPSVFLALFACGKGNDTLNNQNSVMNTKPLGYVAGQVVNATTEQPLMGVNVTISGGGLTNASMNAVTTDASGAFQFGPIAAGAMFALRFVGDGMEEAQISGLQIADAAGNFPTENGALYVGPVGLIPSTGKFSVQVISEAGAPVPKANVTIETLVRYFIAGAAKETAVATAMSDVDGLAQVANLPDVRALPPHLVDVSGVVVSVAPVDLDGDGKPDLRGATMMLTGAEVRQGASTPVVILAYAGDAPLQIIASNIAKLAMPTSTAPSVLDPTEPIRIVFSKPIDRTTVSIDLRDETGMTMIMAPFVTGTLENILFIMPMSGLEAGKKYNLSVRAGAVGASRPDVVNAAAPFFSKPDPNVAIAIAGRFHDVNGDGQWGDAGDQIELTANVPIGRGGQSPAFVARLWVDLDLNGSQIHGDGPGELPPTGSIYPPPITLASAEPSSGNSASPSGFTRFLQPIPITLIDVRGPASGPVAFEIRFDSTDNGAMFVTDVTGRQAPAKTTGSMPLQ